MIPVFALFHLNLAYSSIEAAQRSEVIEKCYWPLLDLIERHSVPLGIELSGWTLEKIEDLSPDWIRKFKQLLSEKRCELIGSGYVQMIGPLAPYEINLKNQLFGLDVYQGLLGLKPRLALVNEMAYSSGMVDVYLRSDYQGIIMDRDNVSLALGLGSDLAKVPAYALGAEGKQIAVLWSDSILFQKFQRYSHGDIRLCDYLAYFHSRAVDLELPLALYANDAEIFDYRPGRYKTESALHKQGEWLRIEQLLMRLGQEGVEWLSPGQALERSLKNLPSEAVQLTSAKYPVPVKKQVKYNLSRWAVSGRDDLWLNTMCYRIARVLLHSHSIDADLWRRLCALWASDLRTHCTDQRWQDTKKEIAALARLFDVELDYVDKTDREKSKKVDFSSAKSAGFTVAMDPEGIMLDIKSEGIEMTLNLRRGMTIHRVGFRSQGFVPVVGTLPHGYFHSIELGADFYSAGLVVEDLAERRRVTDLEWVRPTIFMCEGKLIIQSEIETEYGVIEKEMAIHGEKLAITTRLPDWCRAAATVRVCTITLLPEVFSSQLNLQTVAGGAALETFVLDGECHHTRPASSIVTASGGLGATTGTLLIGDARSALRLSWNPADAAVFPMLSHQFSSPSTLTRLTFSLSEQDETFKSGGKLPSFTLNLSPACLH